MLFLINKKNLFLSILSIFVCTTSFANEVKWILLEAKYKNKTETSFFEQTCKRYGLTLKNKLGLVMQNLGLNSQEDRALTDVKTEAHINYEHFGRESFSRETSLICEAKFWTKDPNLEFKKFQTKKIKGMKKEEQLEACQPRLDEMNALSNTVISKVQMGKKILGARYCFVRYLSLKTKEEN